MNHESPVAAAVPLLNYAMRSHAPPSSSTTPNITFGDSCVWKRLPDLHGHVEAAVTERAQALGAACGLFRVPRILDYDASSNVLTMERIHDAEPLRRVLPTSPRAIDILRRTGAALACVHRQLNLPPELRVHSTLPWLSCPNDGLGAIHGDFNTINVLYKASADVLFVIDWSPAPAFGSLFTQALTHLDLASFVRSLMGHACSLRDAYGSFSTRVTAFLEGYEQQAGTAVALGPLRIFLKTYSRFRVRQLRAHHRYYSAMWSMAADRLLLFSTRTWAAPGRAGGNSIDREPEIMRSTR